MTRAVTNAVDAILLNALMRVIEGGCRDAIAAVRATMEDDVLR